MGAEIGGWEGWDGEGGQGLVLVMARSACFGGLRVEWQWMEGWGVEEGCKGVRWVWVLRRWVVWASSPVVT